LEEKAVAQNVKKVSAYFMERAKNIKGLKSIKGRGLMLGLEFDFKVADIRKKLIYDHHIFTGSANNPNLIRLLPPLTVKEEHFDQFFAALEKEL